MVQAGLLLLIALSGPTIARAAEVVEIKDADENEALPKRVEALASAQAASALKGPVIARTPAAGGTLLLVKGEDGRQHELILVSHNEIEDVADFTAKSLYDEELSTLDRKATIAVSMGAGGYDLVSFALYLENKAEQHELTIFAGFDEKDRRLFPFRCFDGCVHQVHRRKPYVFQRMSWTLPGWESRRPHVRIESCRLEGAPPRLVEGGWTEGALGGGINANYPGTSSGNLMKCSLGDSPPKSLC